MYWNVFDMSEFIDAERKFYVMVLKCFVYEIQVENPEKIATGSLCVLPCVLGFRCMRDAWHSRGVFLVTGKPCVLVSETQP